METGFYYYGARYYEPKSSLWLSVDPLAGYNPIFEDEHYIDRQHNGSIFNAGNLNVYGYTYQNPVIYIDPNGKQNMSGWTQGLTPAEQANQAATAWNDGLKKAGEIL